MKSRSSFLRGTLTPVVTIALLAAIPARAVDVAWDHEVGDNDYMNPLNWAGDEIPASETMVIDLGGADKAVLGGGSPPNADAIRIGYNGSDGAFEQSAGTLAATANSSASSRIGNNGAAGTWTMSGGAAFINAIQLGLGSTVGSRGRLIMSGGDLTISRGYNDYSLHVDSGGGSTAGTFEISGGSLKTRTGVKVGDHGTFAVLGSVPTFIRIGSEGPSSNPGDGHWVQESGGKLRVTIDAYGVTPIFIDEKDGTPGSGWDGDVTFQRGSLLDVGFSGGMDFLGSWDVMTWEGTLVDGGLAFAEGVDTGKWSFAFVDTNGSGSADTLRVTSNTGTDPVAFSVRWNGAGELSWPSVPARVYDVGETTQLPAARWTKLDTVASTPPTNVYELAGTTHEAGFYQVTQRPDYRPRVRAGIIAKLDSFITKNYLPDQNTTPGDIRHGQFHSSDNMRQSECTPVLVWAYKQPDSQYYQDTNALNSAVWSVDHMCRAQGSNGGFNEYHGWCGVPDRTPGKSSVVGFTLHALGNAITQMAGLPEMNPRLLEYVDPNGTGSNDTLRLIAWKDMLAAAMPFQFTGSGRGHAPNQDLCALMGVYAVNEAYAALDRGTLLKTQAEIDALSNEIYYGYPAQADDRPNGQWFSTNGVIGESGHADYGYDGNYGGNVSVRYLGVLAPLDATSASFLVTRYAESLQYFLVPDAAAPLGVYAENGISRRSTGDPLAPNMSAFGVASGYHPALQRLYDITLSRFAADPAAHMIFPSPHMFQIGVWAYCEWLDVLTHPDNVDYRLPAERDEAWVFRDDTMKILVSQPAGGVPTYYTEIWDAVDKARRHVYGQTAETIDSLNVFP